jgi:DNA-binding NarL/FixJ family response regulator
MQGDWRGAAQEWERLGCPYEHAMALMDGDEAAQLQALEIFNQLGARPAANFVQQKLQAVPQQKLDKGRFGGLTAREREVAVLIAQGKSNREIAELMTVGVKTVETYVTRILNKLGFDSRVRLQPGQWKKD